MPQNKISICIASYNMLHLIRDTITSCMKQDYLNLEIIVYDDHSTDGTDELFLNDYHYIRYFRSEKNLGVGKAFTEAIKKANGDIIVLMCADDLFLHEKVISDMANIFKWFSNVGYHN